MKAAAFCVGVLSTLLVWNVGASRTTIHVAPHSMIELSGQPRQRKMKAANDGQQQSPTDACRPREPQDICPDGSWPATNLAFKDKLDDLDKRLEQCPEEIRIAESNVTGSWVDHPDHAYMMMRDSLGSNSQKWNTLLYKSHVKLNEALENHARFLKKRDEKDLVLYKYFIKAAGLEEEMTDSGKKKRNGGFTCRSDDGFLCRSIKKHGSTNRGQTQKEKDWDAFHRKFRAFQGLPNNAREGTVWIPAEENKEGCQEYELPQNNSLPVIVLVRHGKTCELMRQISLANANYDRGARGIIVVSDDDAPLDMKGIRGNDYFFVVSVGKDIGIRMIRHFRQKEKPELVEKTKEGGYVGRGSGNSFIAPSILSMCPPFEGDWTPAS